MCGESLSLVINPDSHAFNGFHFSVCVKRAYVPECFCIGQLCAIAIFRLHHNMTRQLVPLRPGLAHS